MGLSSHAIDVFLAIYRHQSIGRAAVSLGVTQPAVSRILRKLESQLGTTLFERHPSGVWPTEAAKIFLPFAEEIAFNARTAIEEVASLSGRGISTVRIGAVASVGSTVLPYAIQRLLENWPSLRVQLVEGIEDHLSEALARGEIDIAIAGRIEHSVIAFSKSDRLSATLVAIANKNHKLANQSSIGLPDLARYRWVLPPISTQWTREFNELFLRAGVAPPSATVETRSVTTIRALVALTDLLSWQPRSLMSLDNASERLVEINAPDLVWRRQFFVFKRRRGLLGQGALRFVNELRVLCREEIFGSRQLVAPRTSGGIQPQSKDRTPFA